MVQEEIIEQTKTTETRGKPLKCRYCDKTFKIENIEKKKKWSANECICPICGELWCTLPKTERELKYLQQTYLGTREDDDFLPFLRLMYRYCQSLIKKNYSRKLTFDGALDYYANEAITFMVEEFLNKPEFKIELSFGGYIMFKIKQTIFNKADFVDEHVSLDFEFEDGNNLHEIIASNSQDIIARIEEDEDIRILGKTVVGLIEGVSAFCTDPYDDYIRTVSCYIYMTNGELGFDKVFQAFGRRGKEIAQKTLDILRSELNKNLVVSGSSMEAFARKPVEKQNSMILDINELSTLDWHHCHKRR